MRLVFGLLLICLMSTGVARADEIRATFAMDSDPNIPIPDPVKFFSKAYLPLWLQALARPEADLQRQAAETFAQAHEFGFPGMTDARPRLLEILTAEKTHPTARFAAARALIVMDSRDAAPALLKVSQQYGADLRQLVEPALGKWKFQEMRDVWRTRLTASDVRHRELLLAIEGTEQADDQQSAPLLLKIVHDAFRSPVARLAAARAAGKLRDSGLESDAVKLTEGQNASLVNRVCAILLFIRHSSEPSRTALQKWATDPEPAVAGAALERLLQIDPELVIPLAEGAIKSLDPKVRQRGSEAYVARPNPQRLIALAHMLDDVHPTVRGTVRDALFMLSKTPEWDAVIRPAATDVLGAESWRGQEQAILLLASMDHKAAAPRFLQLLESPRDEVLVTAAWGLRKLAIPETLPAIFAKAERQTAIREKDPGQRNSLDHQVVHLFEALGLMHYSPAEPLLRKHIPKSFGYGQYSRAAAVWAMGHLYADKPDEALAAQLAERMKDTTAIPPEMLNVQMMSIIAIGRMGAKSQAGEMKTLMESGTSPTQPNLSMRWAYVRLTGEKLPDIKPSGYSKTTWFLMPLDDAAPAQN